MDYYSIINKYNEVVEQDLDDEEIQDSLKYYNEDVPEDGPYKIVKQ